MSGRDRPGVTAAVFATLAAHDVDIRDLDQVTLRGRLLLGVLLDLQGDPAALRASLTRAASSLGMDCEVVVADTAPAARRTPGGSRSHVTVLGHPLRAGALAHVAQCVADSGGNIDTISQLATEPVSAVELVVRCEDTAALAVALVQAGQDSGVDVAIEPAGLQRRSKRLVALDLDSTLIRDEGIDVLAERAGVGPQVAAITGRAMAGELDFTASLRERVALLAGLPVAEVHAARDALRLTPGASTFVRTLRGLGLRVGVVSGGFTVFTDRFVAELGLDFAAANELEVRDGHLTGGLVGEVVDREAKAAALRTFAARFGVPLAQTVAVGDGANDIDMIEAAGLGVAFNAKGALRAAANASLNVPYLDSVLFLLGVSSEQIAEVAEQR